MYELWYDYIKQKFQNNAKQFYIDTESLISYIKTEDLHKDIAGDVEESDDTSNYDVDRPLPKAKTKKSQT